MCVYTRRLQRDLLYAKYQLAGLNAVIYTAETFCQQVQELQQQVQVLQEQLLQRQSAGEG